jgi:hypothetical protein
MLRRRPAVAAAQRNDLICDNFVGRGILLHHGIFAA